MKMTIFFNGKVSNYKQQKPNFFDKEIFSTQAAIIIISNIRLPNICFISRERMTYISLTITHLTNFFQELPLLSLG